jgi:hypothetical protein
MNPKSPFVSLQGLVLVAGLGLACGTTAVRGEDVLEKTAGQSSVADPSRVTTSDVKTAPPVALRRIGRLDWHTDYATAYRAALAGKRSLFLVFQDAGGAGDRFERDVLSRPELEVALTKVERAVIPTTATVVTAQAGPNTKPAVLLQTSSFAYLYGGAGIALLDLASDKSPTFGQVISAHAFSGRQAYGTHAVDTILSLPPGTVTQRALVYAMRMHPERPQSVWGAAHPVLMQQALVSSQLMVQYGSVGHHDWGNRLAQIGSQAGLSPFEVAASSYGASPLIDAAFELVQNWRTSPAHWGGMSSPQRHFGYDMVQSPSGIWYGTGLFAN